MGTDHTSNTSPRTNDRANAHGQTESARHIRPQQGRMGSMGGGSASIELAIRWLLLEANIKWPQSAEAGGKKYDEHSQIE